MLTVAFGLACIVILLNIFLNDLDCFHFDNKNLSIDSTLINIDASLSSFSPFSFCFLLSLVLHCSIFWNYRESFYQLYHSVWVCLGAHAQNPQWMIQLWLSESTLFKLLQRCNFITGHLLNYNKGRIWVQVWSTSSCVFISGEPATAQHGKREEGWWDNELQVQSAM